MLLRYSCIPTRVYTYYLDSEDLGRPGGTDRDGTDGIALSN